MKASQSARRPGLPQRYLRAAEPTIMAATLKPAQLLSLQAFDVAFRAGSFKAAANALHLSPSAISHRIRLLESVLGVALFMRTHRTIVATPAGKALALATGRAFADLAKAGTPTRGTTSPTKTKA